MPTIATNTLLAYCPRMITMQPMVMILSGLLTKLDMSKATTDPASSKNH